MSHYSVMVRVPSSVPLVDLESTVDEMMAPYHQFECTGIDDEYVKDIDVTSERLEEYQKSSYKERMSFAEFLVYAHDLKVIHPPDVPDLAKTHKYGYFISVRGEVLKVIDRTNPNYKWDGHTLGGRWTGLLNGYEPCKDRDNYKVCWLCNGTGTRNDMKSSYCGITYAGHPVIGDGCNGCGGTGWQLKFASDFKQSGSITRIAQLDFAELDAKTRENISKFWHEWEDFANGKQVRFCDGPRDRALALGMIECKDAIELTGHEWRVVPWDKPDTPEKEKRNRFDVLKQCTKEWIEKEKWEAFYPICTFARLDRNGWQEKGQMGWFGCSSATPESSDKFSKDFVAWIKSGDQNDWLVVVDCHI